MEPVKVEKQSIQHTASNPFCQSVMRFGHTLLIPIQPLQQSFVKARDITFMLQAQLDRSLPA